jgi:branched-chain amino acid transport system ATP-binding protein
VPADALLEARGLARSFGGLKAVDDVSIVLARGSIHALIGTNGAGKSTLVNLLSGELRADRGAVHYGGHDVTVWPQPRRARAGIGRTYQRTTVFMSFTVFENCRLCAQANVAALRSWRRAAPDESVTRAHAALARTGIGALAQRTAGELSHGERRLLEVAMCVATAPQVLLLDEPLAGMGPEETERMLALFAELRADHAILLVEHDMDAVFRVADRITVMVNGAVIASGDPAAVRADAGVQAAYLGGAA